MGRRARGDQSQTGLGFVPKLVSSTLIAGERLSFLGKREPKFFDSPNSDDDPGVFTVETTAVFNNQGDVTVVVSTDGSWCTVRGKTFGALDSAKAG